MVIIIESSGASPVGFEQTHSFGPWKLAVASVDWNAGSAPAAAQNVSITVAVQYLGAGAASTPFAFLTEGPHHTRYGISPLIPGLPVVLHETMYSGARETFPLDFTVAANDVNMLTLDVYYGRSTTPVRYALHAS